MAADEGTQIYRKTGTFACWPEAMAPACPHDEKATMIPLNFDARSHQIDGDLDMPLKKLEISMLHGKAPGNCGGVGLATIWASTGRIAIT